MNYEEVIEYIDNVPKFTKKNGLEHTRMLLERLGNPQGTFRMIHVAGSNGKGSVCSFINQVLIESGKRTGLFISPHLVKLEERFVIQGQPCSSQELLESFEIVMKEVEQVQKKGEPHPSYFELLFLMAMVCFARKKVDYVVLETGLGGRLDATNAIAEPLLTLITSISLEHTEILGDTIEAIAGEKAGIIKPGVPVIFDATNEKAANVIAQKAKECGSRYVSVSKDNYEISEITRKNIAFCYHTEYDRVSLRIPFVAEYQVMNASLAVQALLLLEENKIVTRQNILDGMSQTSWPGRMEQIAENIFLDGAHNVAGIRTLLKTVKRLASVEPILLFSMVKEKNYEKAIEILTTEVNWDKIYVTTIPNTRGIKAQTLADEFLKDHRQVVCIDENREALKAAMALKKPEQLLICTGSLYLVGELKKALEEIEK